MTAVYEHQAPRSPLNTRVGRFGVPAPAPADPARPLAPPPPRLVGRADELAQLVAAVQAPPAVVVLEGEAGIGKTRLLSELLAQLAGSDRLLLVGGCQGIREPFPLGSVLEAVRGLDHRLAGAALSPVTGVLHSLLPELRDRLPEPPERLANPVAERHRLFRGLAELLAAAGPVSLVLEDVHWADPQTVDFLRYLLADPPAGLALLITYRAEEIDPGVRALVGRLPPAVTRCQLVLTPLDEAQTGQLAAAIAGADRVSDEFARYLCERTGGLPFAIEQVVALLGERGVAPGEAGWSRRMLDGLGVPVALRDHVQERAALLPAPVRSLLEVLAVMWYPATEAETAQASGQPAAQVTVGLCDGIRAGLLVDSGMRVGFRHALAAQAIYDGIPGPHRRELHNRVAELLSEAAAADRPLGRIAYHLRQAGRASEWTVVAEQAADRAMALGSYDEAARLLAEILSADAERTPDPAVVGPLAVKLGWAATEATQVTGVVDLLWQVLRQDLPRSVRGELAYLAGVLTDQYGLGYDRSQRLFRQAVGNLADRPELRARALVSLGLSSRPDQPFSQRKRWLDRALATVPEVADEDCRVFLLGKIVSGLVDMGHPEWWELMDRLRALVPELPRTRHQVNAWYSVGATAGFTGHDQIAADLLNGARQAATDHRYHRMALFSQGALATLDYLRGDWTGLDQTLLELIDQTRAHPRCRLLLRAVAGSLALARGQLELAEYQLAEATANRVDGSSYSLALATAGQIRLTLARGDRDPVLERYLPAIRPGHPVWPVIYRVLPWLVAAHLAEGEWGPARSLVQRCRRELRKRAAPLAPAALRHARGLLTLAAGEPVTAAYHLLTAGQRYQLRNCPYEAAQAREAAAGALLAAGRPEAIEQPLREALTMYDRLGAGWDLGRAARLARAHGVSVPARHRGGQRGYGDALTPREREVALLATAGRTNKEIAGELFVSAETVKKHLQAAMRKLGVQSRAALARRLPG